MDVTFDTQAEQEYATANLAKLNTEQQHVVDTIFAAVEEVQRNQPAKCRAFFLDGPGGSGKTMLYNTLISALRARSLQVHQSTCTFI